MLSSVAPSSKVILPNISSSLPSCSSAALPVAGSPAVAFAVALAQLEDETEATFNLALDELEEGRDEELAVAFAVAPAELEEEDEAENAL